MCATQKIFILAESRSGSNWLVETLNNHSQIYLLKELFQPNKLLQYKQLLDSEAQYSDKNYFESHLIDITTKYTGCKILFPQALRFMDFYLFINDYANAKYICLTRKNTVQAEVSDLLAQKHGRWHTTVSMQDIAKIQIDPDFFLKRLEWRRLAKEFVIKMLDAYNVDAIHINYEDLFSANKNILEVIFNFLNIDFEENIFSKEVKLNNARLDQILINYHQLKEFLNDAACERYQTMI